MVPNDAKPIAPPEPAFKFMLLLPKNAADVLPQQIRELPFIVNKTLPAEFMFDTVCHVADVAVLKLYVEE